MKRNKFNPELLKEELKRFKMLENYDFYHEDREMGNYDNTNKLLLGSDLEEEENPEANKDVDNQAADQIGADLGVDNTEEPVADMPPAPEVPSEIPPTPTPAPVEPEAEAEAEEIDVTALVKGSEEAKDSANKASMYSAMLLKKLEDLENRVGDMDKVTRKIDDLETQFKLRNPTENEKLEMRSLNSGPYTQKLSDYWIDKEGQYDVMDVNQKKEYVLTKQNLEQDYSEPQIKKSFDVNDYEEEDI